MGHKNKSKYQETIKNQQIGLIKIQRDFLELKGMITEIKNAIGGLNTRRDTFYICKEADWKGDTMKLNRMSRRLKIEIGSRKERLRTCTVEQTLI